MRYVIAQPCRCGDHAKDEGYMYLENNEGVAIKFESIKKAQTLIDDFFEHEGLCEEQRQWVNGLAVIPELEVISDGTN